MDFKEYQQKARSTAIFDPQYRYMYPALGLAGEAGETCEKVKKMFRDNHGIPTTEKVEEIKKELGDVLWYVANLAADFQIDLEEVAELNIQKLFSRKERGVLQGSGDNR
jgi:NTP pyrophosphatase (non-canonical NTP hydrolase)